MKIIQQANRFVKCAYISGTEWTDDKSEALRWEDAEADQFADLVRRFYPDAIAIPAESEATHE